MSYEANLSSRSGLLSGRAIEQVPKDAMLKEMEMEEEEPGELFSFDEVEALVDESSESLHRQTGVNLPRLTSTPVKAARRLGFVPFGIELPLGSLFYPCCGSDTDHAVTLFGPYVTDCHFSDPYNPPFGRSRPAPDLKGILVPNVETVVVGGRVSRKIDNASCVVYSHEKDGLLTLIEDIGLLSVFYYRGDSYGEGGSNQRWLEPVLFHTVLARLLDGGLIVTNGQNCGSGRNDKTVPWRALCASSGEEGQFAYAGREFLFVGELSDPKRRAVRLWQVRGEQLEQSSRS